MSKLGKVTLFIDNEQLNNSVTVTNYPVEKGEPISDHVQRQPETLDLSGNILTGSSFKADLRYFRECMQNGTQLDYIGRTVARKVIITNISDNRTGAVANGAGVSITLQFIKVVTLKWTATKAKAKTAKKTVGKKKKTTNKKTTKQYLSIYKGMTYWDTARKYGTTVSALEKLNPWPARKIPWPTNKKMRIR